MTDATADAADAEPKKKSKLPLILAVILLLVGAGAGYAVVASGLLSSEEKGVAKTDAAVAFVPIEPLTIGIGGADRSRFLRFAAQVEVAKGDEGAVAAVMPRIVDVLNTYLRSVSMIDAESPAAMLEIRSQLLRRIDLVVGEDKVRDLLIMEFVVN